MFLGDLETLKQNDVHVPVSCERVQNFHQILKEDFGSKNVKNQGPRRIINVGLVQLAGREGSWEALSAKLKNLKLIEGNQSF